ncbi:MAG: hypothetical protein WC514_00120 [Candidatus Paceibacterota bacterium]
MARGIKKQEGFIAITSVLIINALILVLGISMFHASLTDQSMSASYDSGEEASSLAETCLREAFSKLKGNISYTGDESVDVNGMSCSINPVEDLGEHTKKISALARVGSPSYIKRAEEEVRYAVESTAGDWMCESCFIENLGISGDSLVLLEKLAEGEETEAVVRMTDTEAEWQAGSYMTGLRTDGDDLVLEEGLTSGYRISGPLSLNDVKHSGSSKIEWSETIATDTEISIHTKVVESEGAPSEIPGTWNTAANGGPIPEIEESSDLTNRWLWVKQELKTNDISFTPSLHSLTETVTEREVNPAETEGYRISSELDLSGSGKVKDSQIFWQANTRSQASIVIETRFYNGEIWTDWQTATNGREIPGLAHGTDLNIARIQTKAFFSGGPEIYPSLNNINIFIEVEK